jgi:tetratricopeptide (TPR) repeat protein
MRILAAVALLGATAGTAAAQSGVIGQGAGRNAAVATAMSNAFNKLEAPKCEGVDKGLHYKVSSAKVYLKTALENSIPENRARALDNGERVLLEAISQNDAGSNPGSWYYLGRIYLQKGDILGADSAFTRAVTMVPQCKADIDMYRSVAAIALLNPGVEMLKAEKTDSAVALFTLASQVYPDSPHAFFYLGSAAYEADSMEKALGYFDRVLATTPDPKAAEVREQALFNRGVVLLQLQRGQEAVEPLRQFAASHPDDMPAKRALMNAYQQAGMTDSVAVMVKQLETAGEEVPKTAVLEDSPFNRAVALFNEQKWAEAAALTEQVLTTEPNNRDAVYMLARSYYELKKGRELVKAAEQVIVLDPMSESSLQLLELGYGMTKSSAKAASTRLRRNALPVSIGSVQMQPGTGGMMLTGAATGRKALDASGKALAPKPVTLVFEFVNQDGAVVTTQEVAIPAVAEGSKHDISVTAPGEGIVAWRYKQK